MRSLFGALVVLGLAVGLLARPVSGCLSALAPKRDVTKLKKALEHAQACARDNMAEG